MQLYHIGQNHYGNYYMYHTNLARKNFLTNLLQPNLGNILGYNRSQTYPNINLFWPLMLELRRLTVLARDSHMRGSRHNRPCCAPCLHFTEDFTPHWDTPIFSSSAGTRFFLDPFLRRPKQRQTFTRSKIHGVQLNALVYDVITQIKITWVYRWRYDWTVAKKRTRLDIQAFSFEPPWEVLPAVFRSLRSKR